VNDDHELADQHSAEDGAKRMADTCECHCHVDDWTGEDPCPECELPVQLHRRSGTG
jgi:hypothetical protein